MVRDSIEWIGNLLWSIIVFTFQILSVPFVYVWGFMSIATNPVSFVIYAAFFVVIAIIYVFIIMIIVNRKNPPVIGFLHDIKRVILILALYNSKYFVLGIFQWFNNGFQRILKVFRKPKVVPNNRPIPISWK
jgi:hypothetical protein